MAYRFDPKNINGDFDDQEPDLFEDYPLDEDEKGEEDYYDATHTCDMCYGMGDYCHYCKGTGTIKKRKY